MELSYTKTMPFLIHGDCLSTILFLIQRDCSCIFVYYMNAGVRLSYDTTILTMMKYLMFFPNKLNIWYQMADNVTKTEIWQTPWLKGFLEQNFRINDKIMLNRVCNDVIYPTWICDFREQHPTAPLEIDIPTRVLALSTLRLMSNSGEHFIFGYLNQPCGHYYSSCN